MTDQPAKKPVRKRATKKAADKPVPVLDTRPSILDQIKDELRDQMDQADRQRSAAEIRYTNSKMRVDANEAQYYTGQRDALGTAINRITELEKEK